MDNEDKIKGLLILAFFGVLIGGAVITFNNFHSWNSVRTSVVSEYHNPEQTRNTDVSEPGTTENTSDNTDMITEDLEITNTPNGTTDEEPINNEDNTAVAENNEEAAETSDQEQDPDITDTENDPEEENNEGDADMQENVIYKEGFYISPITDEIFERIKGKSFPESCTVSRDDLRYVRVRHYGFEGEIREGELIVNAAIAQDVVEIFQELYDIKYQIEKIRLIDEYDADDERSMEANNSSCFNYRTIAESSTLSNHAYGRAIDINPFYNPYVYERSDGSLFLQPKGSEKYIDRTVDAACIIRKDDACYNIFIKHGFSWGGDWNTKKDYQHFEKTK